ncbi:MAG: BTAD domain-containing putative transcriptional regulator [Desulfobacteraceae bacterium]|jgi:ATP/maltotriose-dependent transcriptional regulator MalT/DNA-binding SARP family transcriptional activator
MLHLAKITAPHNSSIVPRERLFALLDQCLEKKVVWISSPGGSGKTSLVASYLNERKQPHLWYRIDEGDDDIATFFYYMGLASNKASPRFKKNLPLLTPEYLEGIPVFTRRYFEEVGRRLKAPFVIVFDNYQDVPGSSALHGILNIALESLPQEIKVIGVSRNLPPQALSRFHVNNSMERLGWNDIRLSLEETATIVTAGNGRSIRDIPVSLVHERIGGWVAGLVLLIENSRKKGNQGLILDNRAQEEIFPYFANEIFTKTDQETRDFLLRTAFLPMMTAEMARALTGITNAGDILKKLHEQNYFTECRFDKEPNYLYHTLFRDFLTTRARETFSDEEIRSIRAKAALVLTENGLVEDAVRFLIDAGNWAELIPIVLEQAQSLIFQGRNLVLANWIRCFSEGILSWHPWLLYWKGVSLLPLDILESRSLLDRAFHTFLECGDETGVLLSWSGVVDTYLFESNDYKPLDSWISWLDERLRQNPVFPSVETEASVLSSMVSGCLFRQPDHPALRSNVIRLLEIYQRNPNVSICPQTLSFTVLFYIWMGEFDKAEITFYQVKKKAESTMAAPLMRITLKMIESHYAVLSGAEFEEVCKLISEGMNWAEESGVHFMDFLLLAQEGNSRLIRGDEGLTDTYLKKFDSVFKPNRRITHCLNMDMMSLNHLHRGNYCQALLYAEKSEALCNRFGLVYNQGTNGVLLAQIYHERGDYVQALLEINKTKELFTRMGSRLFLYSCSMVEAYIHLERGNDHDGLPALRKALALGRIGNYASAPYVWRKNVICRLCIKALEAGIETEFVQNLIRKQNLRPDLAPVEIETWPWPVRIYTLGRFALLTHDAPVNVSGKSQKKPLMMLKAIIALGARDIKEETLTDLLWPEAEGDAGHNAFTTTLARLRKLICHDSAIQLSGGRVSLDNRICWVDRWAFERLCTGMETVMGQIQNGRSEVQALKTVASKAAGVYKGPFLDSDEDQPWTVYARERLRGRYLHLTGQTGSFLSQEGDDEAAIHYYRKGIEAEPLAEYLHQSLISAYLRLDRLAEALAAFKQCRKILDSHSIPLSQKTEALRRQIHKN